MKTKFGLSFFGEQKREEEEMRKEEEEEEKEEERYGNYNFGMDCVDGYDFVW